MSDISIVYLSNIHHRVWNIEPNDYSGIQDCVGIFVKQTWDDMSCGEAGGYICEALKQGRLHTC